MSSEGDGCARSSPSRGAGGDAAPLPVGTAHPVLCRECGNVFGGGAEAGTVCPYCMGSLYPLVTPHDAAVPGLGPSTGDIE